MPLVSTKAKPAVRKAVDKESSAFVLVTGLFVIRVIVPLTCGSTKMVCPVALAITLATDSISALLKDSETVACSTAAPEFELVRFCAITPGKRMN